jgi:hypothetical protein
VAGVSSMVVSASASGTKLGNAFQIEEVTD